MENQSQLLPLLTNLLSGFIGSIIGAFIGAWATLKASKVSLNGLYQQEKGRRKYEERKQSTTVIHALLKELKENQTIAQEWQNKTNTVLMSREAWATFKGHISFLPDKLQRNLPYTYSLLSDYNSLVECDRYKLSHGAGYVDDKMRAAAEKFNGDVGGVIAQFEELLK